MIDDIVQYDNIWHDGQNFCRALDDDNKVLANTIRLQRVGWIVDLAVTESSGKGKVRFQIQALRATSNDEVIKLVDKKIIKPPIPGLIFWDLHILVGSCPLLFVQHQDILSTFVST